MWHKIAAFLFISHTALLKQVFQVISWQALLCNTPLNICQMRVVSTSHFFWGWWSPSVKSLFQLSAPWRLMEPGYLLKRISVYQSVSGECGRHFVVNTLSSIFQTILQEPYSLISPLYFALSSHDLGQSQRTHLMWSVSQSQQGSSLKKKFLFYSAAQNKVCSPWAGPNGPVWRNCRNRWTTLKLWSAGVCSNPAQTSSYWKLLQGRMWWSGLLVFIRGANRLALAEMWASVSWRTIPCLGQRQQKGSLH